MFLAFDSGVFSLFTEKNIFLHSTKSTVKLQKNPVQSAYDHILYTCRMVTVKRALWSTG